MLFVDNALTDYALLVRFIEHGGYALQSARVENAAQMYDLLGSARWDAVISEIDLPGFPLADVLAVLHEAACDTPLIVVTSAGDEDAATAALAAGADDYVSKSRLTRLVPALKRSLAVAAARDLRGVVGDLITALAADVSWFAANATDSAAHAHVQNMQRALAHASERAQHGMHAMQPPGAN